MLRQTLGFMRELPRLHEIASVFIRHGLGDFVQRIGIAGVLERAGQILHRSPVSEQVTLHPAERMRMALEELGPTFVKLGQVMATRVDLFPPRWIAEFEKLQAAVPAVPFEALVPQLTQALGRLFALAGQDADDRRRPVEERDGVRPRLRVAVDVADDGPEQPVRMGANLVRRPVADPERPRPAADVDAERLPRERLLEDPLSEVAREEERVGPATRERREEAHVRDAQVLRFVDDGEVERTLVVLGEVRRKAREDLGAGGEATRERQGLGGAVARRPERAGGGRGDRVDGAGAGVDDVAAVGAHRGEKPVDEPHGEDEPDDTSGAGSRSLLP